MDLVVVCETHFYGWFAASSAVIILSTRIVFIMKYTAVVGHIDFQT